jgi:hypothetical protein
MSNISLKLAAISLVITPVDVQKNHMVVFAVGGVTERTSVCDNTLQRIWLYSKFPAEI